MSDYTVFSASTAPGIYAGNPVGTYSLLDTAAGGLPPAGPHIPATSIYVAWFPAGLYTPTYLITNLATLLNATNTFKLDATVAAPAQTPVTNTVK